MNKQLIKREECREKIKSLSYINILVSGMMILGGAIMNLLIIQIINVLSMIINISIIYAMNKKNNKEE